VKIIDQVHAYLRERGAPASRAHLVAKYGGAADGALVGLLQEGSVRRVASATGRVNDWQYVRERPAKRTNFHKVAIDTFLREHPWSTAAEIRAVVPDISRQWVDQLLKAGLADGRYERRNARFVGDFTRWRLSAKARKTLDAGFVGK